MNEFAKSFTETLSLVFYWIDKYQFYMSEIITPWGLCFTYNIAFSHDLLDLNSTSNDFHYHHFNRVQKYYKNYQQSPTKLPKTISTSNNGLWVGFGPNIKNGGAIQNNFEGYKILLHNPLELPTKLVKIINFNHNFPSEILVNAQVNKIDEALVGYEPNE